MIATRPQWAKDNLRALAQETVTINASLLREQFKRVSSAMRELQSAVNDLGKELSGVVVSQEVVNGDLDLRGLRPALCFQRALVTTIELRESGDVIHHGDWEECDEMPLAVRTALLSDVTETFVVGKYIYRIAQ
jgi:hypothetical protein